MITLYAFGPMFGLPDPSPFVTKVDVLLKMAKLPYQTVKGSLSRAPMKKMPYIKDDGQLIADSTLIRLYLEQKYGIDFDSALTPRQKAYAWTIEKMLDDHLYFIVLHNRWVRDENFYKGPVQFFAGVPALLRPLVIRKIRNNRKHMLWGQGTGRYSDEERLLFASRAIDALADMLGDQPYVMGTTLSSADASVFPFVQGILCELFDGPIRQAMLRHANLIAYNQRMLTRFYPDYV